MDSLTDFKYPTLLDLLLVIMNQVKCKLCDCCCCVGLQIILGNVNLENFSIRVNVAVDDVNLLEGKVSIPTIITMVTIASTAATHGKAGILHLNKRISMTLTMKHAPL